MPNLNWLLLGTQPSNNLVPPVLAGTLVLVLPSNNQLCTGTLVLLVRTGTTVFII